MSKFKSITLAIFLTGLASMPMAHADAQLDKARANFELQIKDLPEAEKVKARQNFDRLVSQAGGQVAPATPAAAGTSAAPAIDPATAMALAGSIYGVTQSAGNGRYVSDAERAQLAQQVLKGLANGNKDSAALLTASEPMVQNIASGNTDAFSLVTAAASNPQLIESAVKGAKALGSAISGGLGKLFGSASPSPSSAN